jgi:hypothetical protein
MDTKAWWNLALASSGIARSKSKAGVITTIAVAVVTTSFLAQQRYEPPPKLTATALVGATVAKGPHYQVAEAVRTDGYFHEFNITSTFGSFQAVGRTQLAVRIQEIAALAALEDVSKTEVFLAAAGQSVVKIGKGAAAAVTNPQATAKGLGAGVKRFGVNLGRRTERAVGSAKDDTTGDEGSAAGGAASSLLGVNAAMRRWAQKVSVDPYTTNAVLRKALDDIAKVDAAGSIATKVAVPIPGVVGLTSTVGAIVWGKDPEEVRKHNEAGLRTLGVPEPTAKALFGNRWVTLTYQTRLVAALSTVKVGGVADYVESAAAATSEREALFFVESAEMLQERHAREPVARVLTDSRAMVAVFAGGRSRALLPLDWIPWTAETEKALSQIARRAREELKATRLEIELTGRASDRTVKELPGLGWTVVPTESKR